MIKFLRIFSFVISFPAMLLFFYLIIKALDTTGPSGSGGIRVVVFAIVALFVPVFFNRLAWILEKVKGKKA